MVQRPKIRDFSCDDYLDSDDEGIMYTNTGDSSDTDEGECNVTSFRRNSLTNAVSDGGGDEFEKEMAAELLNTMKKLTMPIKKEEIGLTEESTSKENESMAKEDSEFYNDIYFDSDDSDGEKYSKTKPQPKRKMMTDEDLFYDPDMDDEDQEWIDGTRRKCQLKQRRLKGKSESQKLPNSDAVLNCPACFTTLCLDCQRHEIYNHQYRAMFVFNCRVDFTERLTFPKKLNKKETRKLRKQKGKSSKNLFVKINENVDHESMELDDQTKPVTVGTEMHVACTKSLSQGTENQEVRTKPVIMTTENQEDHCEPGTMATEKQDDLAKPVTRATENQEDHIQPVILGTEKNEDCNKPVTLTTGKQDDQSGHVAHGTENTLTLISIPESLMEGKISEVDTCTGLKMISNSGQIGNSFSIDSMSFQGGSNDDIFHPVKCEVCNTKVAVYDTDEVYHFFSVLASY